MNAEQENAGCQFKTVRMTCRSAVKQHALELARQTRAQGWTRVGSSFLDRIEAKCRAAIAEEVRLHPSKGKTLL